MVEKIYVSWKEIFYMIHYLELTIKRSKEKFDGIYALMRGGLIPGVILSHSLNLPMLNKPTNESLIIEDISETGKTLKNIKHKKIACLYTSLWTEVEPDYFAKIKTNKDSWLIFAWENQEQEETYNGTKI
jgi:hypoxanthine phosphoribosyltransferase